MSGDKFLLFVNSTSKKLFEYICTNPGSYLMNIVHSTSVDRMMASRYLEKMCDDGIVGKIEFKGKTIFYPSGLRADDIEKAFSQLKHQTRKEIFLFILDNPGCHQRMIVNQFRRIHERHVTRLLASLKESGLIDDRRDGNLVRYNVGSVGRKIIIGSFETIDPMVIAIRESTGQEVSVSMTDDNIVKLEVLSGESITFRLGSWRMMNLDENAIFENKYLLLGDGGEQSLIAIYSGCASDEMIQKFTALPIPVVHAKLETLRRMGLIVFFSDSTSKPWTDLKITSSGKNLVERILKIKKN